MSETHVNAYKLELQEAETAEAQARGRVESLKKTIKSMEPEEEPKTEAKKKTEAK